MKAFGYGSRLTSALAGLAVLTAACAGGSAGRESPDAKLVALRAAAALPPCPDGVGNGLPALTLECLSGGADVRLRATSSGRPTLVNIWATWCRPCVAEVPLLVATARSAQGKVDVLGVLTEDEPANGLKFARQFHMPYTSVLDPDGKVLRAFSPGPPATLFVDARGRVAFVKRGEIRSAAELRGLVRTHLGVQLS